VPRVTGLPAVSPANLQALVDGRFDQWPGRLTAATALLLLSAMAVPEFSLQAVPRIVNETSHGATRFLSDEQSETAALVLLQPLHQTLNVLTVLPTSGQCRHLSLFLNQLGVEVLLFMIGGKTNCWLVPTLREHAEQLNGTTLLVLPYVALRLHVQALLRLHGLPVWVYEDSSSPVILSKLPTAPAVVLLSVDDLHQRGHFVRFLQANLQRIARVVLDEAHVCGTQQDFRGQLERFRVFLGGDFPVVCLSATMPAALWSHILGTWAMTDDQWTVVRAQRTLRANIAYAVHHLTDESEALNFVIQQVASAVTLTQPQGRLRLIIYAPTRKEVDAITATLKHSQLGSNDTPTPTIRAYHNGLDASERAATFAAFNSKGKNKTVVVGTTGFGSGLDVPDVRSVFIVGTVVSLIELVQMSGRAGRDQLPASCQYILWDQCHEGVGRSGHSSEWEPESKARDYAKPTVTATCRRVVLSSIVDAHPYSCLELDDPLVELCDVCGTLNSVFP
jgi:superfamily II DNA helicase RecQ